MKKLVSILLLVITSWYIMPVKNIFQGKPTISITCADNNGEEPEEIKKEAQKDFFLIPQQVLLMPVTQTLLLSSASVYPSSLLHTVETPPPDLV